MNTSGLQEFGSPTKRLRWTSPEKSLEENNRPVQGMLVQSIPKPVLINDDNEYSLNFGNLDEKEPDTDYDPLSHLYSSISSEDPKSFQNHSIHLPTDARFNQNESPVLAAYTTEIFNPTTFSVNASTSSAGTPLPSPPQSPSANSPNTRSTTRPVGLNKTVYLQNNVWYKSAFVGEHLGKNYDPNLVDTYCEWAEYRILKEFLDKNPNSSLRVCETELNTRLEFTQTNLSEPIDDNMVKDTIYEMFIELAKLWETGHFIIPDIKKANICSEITDAGTLRTYLIDWNFPRHRYDNFGSQVKDILELNLEEGNLTNEQIETILNHLRAVIKNVDGNIQPKLLSNISEAIHSTKTNHSFSVFNTSFNEAIANKQVGLKPFLKKDDLFTPLDHLTAKKGKSQDSISTAFLNQLHDDLAPGAAIAF